ncbi:hypothetical protein J5277_09700 [Rhizobium sp. 16-449-1b]|uniref:hypothetical protein n=1 Tax=Rhizobium sp. 16-449-1b TaxID=2819989 RepID=UPI001ADCB0E2|nr:hypothetical protein [Rhizobium sp. 16-449-1b]MBO9194379.1 hypothetical protein [Rhizobium sp. 16-449-1b]
MIYAVRTFKGNQALVEFANTRAMERAAADIGSEFSLRRVSHQHAAAWVAQGKENETALTVDDIACPEVV